MGNTPYKKYLLNTPYNKYLFDLMGNTSYNKYLFDLMGNTSYNKYSFKKEIHHLRSTHLRRKYTI